MTVRCVRLGSSRDHSLRATIAISRGHRVYAFRSGSGRRMVLHTRHRLRGRYVLTVEFQGYRPFRITIRIR